MIRVRTVEDRVTHGAVRNRLLHSNAFVAVVVYSFVLRWVVRRQPS